jgi:hypothetical protein
MRPNDQPTLTREQAGPEFVPLLGRAVLGGDAGEQDEVGSHDGRPSWDAADSADRGWGGGDRAVALGRRHPR